MLNKFFPVIIVEPFTVEKLKSKKMVPVEAQKSLKINFLVHPNKT